MTTASIVTATWNCATTLADCLSSVASQEGVCLEHIVIDGASTDGTQELLAHHRDQLATLVSEPDHGIYDALNKGVSLASGEIVGFLHADDVYAGPHVLARVAAAFSDPAVSAVYGDLEYVAQDDPSRVIRHWRSGQFSPAKLRRGWMPPHPTLFLRRSLYERFGAFDLRYRIAADYDFMLRVLGGMDGEVVYLPEVLVRMRVGGASNRSLKQILRKSREDYLALRRNRMGGLPALAWKNLSKLPQFFKRG